MNNLNPISLHELARMFGKNKSTVWRWIRTDSLPKPRKIGKCFFFDRAEIDAWWEQKGLDGRKVYQP